MGTNVKSAPSSGTKPSKEVSKVNPLDAQLLRLADKGLSGEEIGQEVGLPAAEAMSRIRRILSERDWLTEIEQKKLNIMALRKVKDRIMENVDRSFWDVDEMEQFIKATKLMSELLDESNRITDEQLSVVSGAQARALVKLMTYAWDRAIERLREEYPNVDVTILVDTFNDGLREGVQVIEAAE